MLEIASGTGQHAAHLARRFAHCAWQPTEYGGGSGGPEDAAYGDLAPVFASIEAWCAGLGNVQRPVELDAAASSWGSVEAAPRFDAVYAANVLHIAPYKVSEGLFAGAGRVLAADGCLAIYGPFGFEGKLSPESNVAFDQRLRAQDPEWGVRDATALAELASTHGLRLVERAELPANNYLLIFRKK